MFKWVAGLCAAIYLTLLIVGAPPEGGQTAAIEIAALEPEAELLSAEPEAVEPVASVEAEPDIEQVIADAAQDPLPQTVAPLNPTPIVSVSLDQGETSPAAPLATVAVSASQPVIVDTPEPTATPAVELSNPGVGEIWTVTGSRVNLRTAPTTNSSVVGQTVRGESAEVTELLGNGWAKVYIIEKGIEAYMSADFIRREG